MTPGVQLRREATAAVIVHDCEPRISVRIELGPHATSLADHEIVDRYVRRLCALGTLLVGEPQLRWDDAILRWVPRGCALRCTVEGIDEPIVVVGDSELTLGELGRMLASHGAEICLVLLDE
jgi:hypothetical protein